MNDFCLLRLRLPAGAGGDVSSGEVVTVSEHHLQAAMVKLAARVGQAGTAQRWLR